MPNPTLTIRIPADLKSALTEAAAADNRSLTSFTQSALWAAIELGPGMLGECAMKGKEKYAAKSRKTRAR